MKKISPTTRSTWVKNHKNGSKKSVEQGDNGGKTEAMKAKETHTKQERKEGRKGGREEGRKGRKCKMEFEWQQEQQQQQECRQKNTRQESRASTVSNYLSSGTSAQLPCCQCVLSFWLVSERCTRQQSDPGTGFAELSGCISNRSCHPFCFFRQLIELELVIVNSSLFGVLFLLLRLLWCGSAILVEQCAALWPLWKRCWLLGAPWPNRLAKQHDCGMLWLGWHIQSNDRGMLERSATLLPIRLDVATGRSLAAFLRTIQIPHVDNEAQGSV